jgi:hypothetical protein
LFPRAFSAGLWLVWCTWCTWCTFPGVGIGEEMGFDATDFLAGPFDGDLAAVLGPRGHEPGPEAAEPPRVPKAPAITSWDPRPDPLGADGWPADSVPPGEPCPKCGGLLWWEDLEGGRHRLDCEGAKFQRAEELAGLARGLRAASGLPPGGVAIRPGECPRCRSTGFRDAAIHNGQSVRRDCARCGRTIEFVTWYERVLDPGAN